MKFYKILFIIILFSACNTEKKSDLVSDDYRSEIEVYKSETHQNRIKYLQLCGLFKIDSVESTFGKNANNTFTIKKEKLPETIGSIIKEDTTYVFHSANNIQVKSDSDSIFTTSTLLLDNYGSSMKLSHNQLTWQIITRADSQYLRVWDSLNPMVTVFKGYELYELNPDFIFEANFSYFDQEKTEDVESQLGINASTKFIGTVTFMYLNESFSLDVGIDGFTMVSDDTSGDDTYGGGRYVYLELPKTDGPVVLDFNRLYNPPCSFSQYTTCLYPPRQNYLPFQILAGEKLKRN